MTDDADQGSVEEELRTGSSRPTIRIVVLVAVVLIAALAFVVIRAYSGSPRGRSAASAPPRTPTAARTPAAGRDREDESGVRAVLVPGSLRGFSLVRGRIVYAAELINTSGMTLRVKYPIRLPGVGPTTAMVTFAELTDSQEPFSPGRAPPPVAQIAARQHVTLQIELHLRCGAALTWPTGRSTIPIELSGHSTPAVFTFADLFGFNIRAGLQRACSL